MAGLLSEVLPQYRRIADENVKACTLIRVNAAYCTGLPPVSPLTSIKTLKDGIKHTDEQIENALVYWEKTKDIKDDKIRLCGPFFGMQEHSSFFGGKVVYGKDTSYVEAVMDRLEDESDLECLRFDEQAEGYRMMLECLQHAKERSAKEGFDVGMRGFSGPMELANNVRGNDYFMDLYDEEELVLKLNQICTDAVKRNVKNQLDIAGSAYGGTISGMGVWIPGKSIGHLSEDASCMCSEEMYRKFCRAFDEEVVKEYDCALMHVHVMGKQILPVLAEMPKIKYIQFQRDPKQPSPIDVCRSQEEYIKDKVMIIALTDEEIYNNKEYFKNHKTIIDYNAGSLKDAMRMIEFVRSL